MREVSETGEDLIFACCRLQQRFLKNSALETIN